MARPLNLDVNTSGAWRRVAEFDADHFADQDLFSLVDQLLRGATYERVAARLILPKETAPLWTWTRADGWKKWVAA